MPDTCYGRAGSTTSRARPGTIRDQRGSGSSPRVRRELARTPAKPKPSRRRFTLIRSVSFTSLMSSEIELGEGDVAVAGDVGVEAASWQRRCGHRQPSSAGARLMTVSTTDDSVGRTTYEPAFKTNGRVANLTLTASTRFPSRPLASPTLRTVGRGCVRSLCCTACLHQVAPVTGRRPPSGSTFVITPPGRRPCASLPAMFSDHPGLPSAACFGPRGDAMWPQISRARAGHPCDGRPMRWICRRRQFLSSNQT